MMANRRRGGEQTDNRRHIEPESHRLPSRCAHRTQAGAGCKERGDTDADNFVRWCLRREAATMVGMTTADDARRRVRNMAAAYATDDAIEIDALLAAIRDLGPQYAFEREGRADAVAAVRHALPSMEQELLDVIVEDHACEVAALREAIAQLAAIVRRTPEGR